MLMLYSSVLKCDGNYYNNYNFVNVKESEDLCDVPYFYAKYRRLEYFGLIWRKTFRFSIQNIGDWNILAWFEDRRSVFLYNISAIWIFWPDLKTIICSFSAIVCTKMFFFYIYYISWTVTVFLPTLGLACEFILWFHFSLEKICFILNCFT
jgi:hypothetical protein